MFVNVILVVSCDQLPYIMITWSTAVYHDKYTAPCYRVKYANSDRINDILMTLLFYSYVSSAGVTYKRTIL